MSFPAFHEQWESLYTEGELRLQPQQLGHFCCERHEACNRRVKHLPSLTAHNLLPVDVENGECASAVCSYLVHLVSSSRCHVTLAAATAALARQLRQSSGCTWTMQPEMCAALAFNLGLKRELLPVFSQLDWSSQSESSSDNAALASPGKVGDNTTANSRDVFTSQPPMVQVQHILSCLALLLKRGAWCVRALNVLFELFVCMLVDAHFARLLLHASIMQCIELVLQQYPVSSWNAQYQMGTLVAFMRQSMPEAVWGTLIEWLPCRGRGDELRKLCAFVMIQQIEQVQQISLTDSLTVSDIVVACKSLSFDGGGGGIISIDTRPCQTDQLHRRLLQLQLVDAAVGFPDEVADEDKTALKSLAHLVSQRASKLPNSVDELSAIRTDVKNYSLWLITKWKHMLDVGALSLTGPSDEDYIDK